MQNVRAYGWRIDLRQAAAAAAAAAVDSIAKSNEFRCAQVLARVAFYKRQPISMAQKKHK